MLINTGSHWLKTIRKNRLARISDRYTEIYGLTCAANAANDMGYDTAIYSFMCIDILNDYIQYVNSEVSKIPSSSSAAFFNRKRNEAIREFMKKRGPELANKVKERVTPRLRMTNNNNYETALNDKIVPQEIKDSLKKANGFYTKIREAAENITKPGKNTKKGRTLEEFVQWIIETNRDASFFCRDVINRVEPRLKS